MNDINPMLPKWYTFFDKPLKDYDVLFELKKEKVHLSRKPNKIYYYYREKVVDDFVKKMLNNITNNSINIEKGQKLKEGIFDYPNYDPVKVINWKDLWNDNLYSDRGWHWLHQQLISLRFLMAAYTYSNDNADLYLKKIKSLIQSWIDANFVKSPPSKLSWHDHATAYRLRNLFLIFEFIRQKDNDIEFICIILKLIHIHCIILVDQSFYTKFTNHGFYQSMILYWATLLYPEMEYVDQINDIAKYRLNDEIKFMFTLEGVHVENSPGYHHIVLRNLEFIQELYQNYKDNQSAKELEALIDKAWAFMAYVIKPNGELPLLGDTIQTNLRRNKLASKWIQGYEYYRYVATAGRQGERPPFVDNVFPISGYAIFRDNWYETNKFDQGVYILFKSGFISQYHRHDDDLSLVLYAFGEDWLVDGGRLNYNEKDPMRIHLRSPYAHNTVIPEKDFKPIRKINNLPEGTGIESYCFNGNKAYVSGCTKIYPGLTIKRTLEYKKPYKINLEDKVIVDSQEKIPSEIFLLFHIPEDKRIFIEHDKVIVKSKKGHVMNIRPEKLPQDIFVQSGIMEPIIQGWRSPQPGILEKNQCLVIRHSNKNFNTKIKTDVYICPMSCER